MSTPASPNSVAGGNAQQSSAPATALILDYGGVITSSTFERLHYLEEAFGLAKGEIAWYGPFDPERDALWTDMQADKISERDYWRLRAVELGKKVGTNWQTATDMVSYLQKDAQGKTRDSTRPQMTQLVKDTRAAGLKVGVLSNELDLFNGPEFRKEIPIFGMMDSITDATYTAFMKPDVRIYQLASQSIGVPIENCLMVDDQMRNIRGALNAGMQAEWFDMTQLDKTFAAIRKKLGIA